MIVAKLVWMKEVVGKLNVIFLNYNIRNHFLHIFTNSSYTFYASLQKVPYFLAKSRETELRTMKNRFRNYVLMLKKGEMSKLHNMGRIWGFIVKRKERFESKMGNLK